MEYKLTTEDFQKITAKLAEVYREISARCRPNSCETQQILIKLSEAGMWFRMYKDLEATPTVGMQMKKVERRGQEKENPN